MTFNWEYYKEFTLWGERQIVKRARLAQTSYDWLGFAIFVREIGTTYRNLIQPWEGAVKCFKGKWWEIAGKVGAFIKANPDPLKRGRDGIEALYTKYGDRPASAAPTSSTPDSGEIAVN